MNIKLDDKSKEFSILACKRSGLENLLKRLTSEIGRPDENKEYSIDLDEDEREMLSKALVTLELQRHVTYKSLLNTFKYSDKFNNWSEYIEVPLSNEEISNIHERLDNDISKINKLNKDILEFSKILKKKG